MTATDIDTGTEKMLARVEDGIGWMTYNNPERHNAMSVEMTLAVPGSSRAFQRRSRRPRDRGHRRGRAGVRLRRRHLGVRRAAHVGRGARRVRPRDGRRVAALWRELDKPIIAMIRGYCIGGGLLVAMRADIRIAAEDSQFAVPAARLGLGYAFGGVEELVALVGPSWAAEILFSAGGCPPTRHCGSGW